MLPFTMLSTYSAFTFSSDHLVPHGLSSHVQQLFASQWTCPSLICSRPLGGLACEFHFERPIKSVGALWVPRKGQMRGRLLNCRASKCRSVFLRAKFEVVQSRVQALNRNFSGETGDSSTATFGEDATSCDMASTTISVPHYSSITLVSSIHPRLKRLAQLAPTEQAFLLLGFVAFMTTGALFAFLGSVIPTLNAMRKVALSLERLADTAREEMPGTMAAIRLSGMEISDLTMELSDLSQEISEGVKSSARAVQVAEVGIRRIGALATSQTLTMLQERASLPVEVVKPVVANAAETTWQAVAHAQRAVLSITALPVLSRWIHKRNDEEEKKPILEGDLESQNVTACENNSGESITMSDT